MTAKNVEKSGVSFITVDEDQADRRLDNFLISHFSDLPKTRIYKMIRKGEVRVNKGRIKQNYRLQSGDTVRIPPIYFEEQTEAKKPPNNLSELIKNSLLYEDEHLIAINKPTNVAVHSGSNINFGVIEILRHLRPESEFLELVHRLDRATSGCLLIAKNHKTLRALHDIIKESLIEKRYLALLKGNLHSKSQSVDVSLSKKDHAENQKVIVDVNGKKALTHFHTQQEFNLATLCQVELMTGRTHQIRVHAAHIKHPLAGDEKYGDWDFNRQMKKQGLKRLFLHAEKLSFEMPLQDKKHSTKHYEIHAPLPDELKSFLKNLD